MRKKNFVSVCKKKHFLFADRKVGSTIILHGSCNTSRTNKGNPLKSLKTKVGGKLYSRISRKMGILSQTESGNISKSQPFVNISISCPQIWWNICFKNGVGGFFFYNFPEYYMYQRMFRLFRAGPRRPSLMRQVSAKINFFFFKQRDFVWNFEEIQIPVIFFQIL